MRPFLNKLFRLLCLLIMFLTPRRGACSHPEIKNQIIRVNAIQRTSSASVKAIGPLTTLLRLLDIFDLFRLKNVMTNLVLCGFDPFRIISLLGMFFEPIRQIWEPIVFGAHHTIYKIPQPFRRPVLRPSLHEMRNPHVPLCEKTAA